jgi:hypothetical protein
MKRTHDEVSASVSATARAASLDDDNNNNDDEDDDDDEDEEERVRCSEDEDGPTLEIIFNEILQQNPKNHARNQRWLGLFESNCQSYGWNNGCGCEYHERGHGGLGSSAYCTSHVVASISMNISHFLGYSSCQGRWARPV